MVNQEQEEKLTKETEELKFLCKEYAKLFEMPANCDLLEITQELLQSSFVKAAQKKDIETYGRRFFVFIYPSDDLKVKGIISFVPKPEEQSTLVYLRGGNRLFGLLNPGSDIMCAGQYTVIATTYRGSVGDGVDEFGGEDVNDVKSLVDFIPELEAKLNFFFRQKMFLLGASRGGMQMFLALARFPELQSRFAKIVSLSGMLDLQECLLFRDDMKKKFIEDFGLIEGVNEEEWISRRNPILVVNKLDPTVPVLIIQGAKDIRVNLKQGYRMVDALKSNGNPVTYWEIEEGDHCLNNTPDRVNRILRWLE